MKVAAIATAGMCALLVGLFWYVCKVYTDWENQGE